MKCQDNQVYAGFVVRFFAYCIDALLIGSITGLISLTGSKIAYMNSESRLNKYALFDIKWLAVIVYLCNVAYFIVLTYFEGATVGKKLLNIRVVSSENFCDKFTFFDVLYRETIGKYLSGILFIGYIMIATTKEKTALHDVLSDTRVVFYNKFVIRKSIYKTVVNTDGASAILPNGIEKKDNIPICLDKKTDTENVVYRLP